MKWNLSASSTGALLTTLVLAAGAAPVAAGPLRIDGTAGYLSEWEIVGAATEQIARGGTEILGSVTWKHVGLCSVSGPLQKSGAFRARILGAGPAARIEAILSFEDVRCAYSGAFSGRSTGHMDCSDAKGVPLTISIGPASRQ